MRSGLAGLLLLVLLALGAGSEPACAQAVTFGAADDPRELIQRVWWQHENRLDVLGGLSLIGPQWRVAGGFNLNLITRSLMARLGGTLRGGLYGEYGPDVDEAYDVLRLVEFARYNGPRTMPFHARAGLIDKIRLGTGHLVNFYSSKTAWDERTVGAEAVYEAPLFDVAAFTDNLLLDGVTGGRLAVRPFFGAGNARLRSATLGFNYVADLGTFSHDEETFTGYNVDFSVNAFEGGSVVFAPFASFAWYPKYGSGLSVGVNFESPNFIDLARFHFQLALEYNGQEFIPGFVGSFYQVNNPSARILNSDDFLADSTQQNLVGIPIGGAFGGNALAYEFRLLVFERFEFLYFFRRNYNSQALSEHHLRLFFRAQNKLNLDVGIDRGGLRGFFSLFNDLGDQSALVFGLNYRLFGPLWLDLRARYTYELLRTTPEGLNLFLVQRRFEPMTGLRFAF